MKKGNKNFDIEEVREFIKNSSPESIIYFGCDSKVFTKERKKDRKKGDKSLKGMAKYSTVVVIHKDGNKGAKIFGKIEDEEIKDGNMGRPFARMYREIEKVSELVQEFEEELIDRTFQIHIDVNKEDFGSHVAYGTAIGYINSLFGIDPVMKNEEKKNHPWAASCAADRMGNY